ncbi:hypothetical protein DdX_11252 [Ditylenchus destructor]|uniref:Uncharacterized protein n=1 Tax=Ditylenchus destructor TaxID=166010 RepID=A0AAD4N113_9BILA|nr:hypothetical protein DdX_11252 [Ditylenchus destructor]
MPFHRIPNIAKKHNRLVWSWWLAQYKADSPPISTSVCCGIARVHFIRFTSAVSHFLLHSRYSTLSIFPCTCTQSRLINSPERQQSKGCSSLPNNCSTKK